MSSHKTEGGVQDEVGMSPVSVGCTRLSPELCFYILT